VLLQPLRDIKLLFEAPGKRYTDVELEEMSRQEVGPRPGFGPGRPGGPGGPGGPNFGNIEFRRKRMAFLVAEGVAAIIDPSPGTRGDSGSVNVQGPGPGEGSRDAKDPPVVPQLVLAAEHYNRILRTLNNKVPVTLEVNVQNKFYDADLNSFNIVGEIPGSDKADEIVMLGSHFDSWHGGSGATDNAVSCAVVMEAMRILKASGLKMRRTVRAALWTGEEQGLLGSRAYVKEHFADRETMQLKPEHEKLAAYFNQDNGGGAYRGVYLQGNEAVAPIFAAWMKPFHNLGMTTLTIRPTGGTDHLAFDGVGLPGFQFVQDPMEYGTRTHHTNLDLYDRVLPEDVMKNAVIMASFVYHAANRDQKLPRKPLPKPVRPAAPGATPTASR
jgi:carboxypeptidase Q